MKVSRNILTLGAICAVTLLQIFPSASALQVMELMAPYKIRNVANNRYLTAGGQGIIGLKTGKVTTQPYLSRMEQQWTIAWDPSFDNVHDGYRLENRMEFLNQVTTFYPDGSTTAVPNIYELIELRNGARIFRNKRSRKCLQILNVRSAEVGERACSIKNKGQHWMMELLDLNMKIGGRKYRIRNPFWDIESRMIDVDNDDEEDDADSGSSEY